MIHAAIIAGLAVLGLGICGLAVLAVLALISCLSGKIDDARVPERDEGWSDHPWGNE